MKFIGEKISAELREGAIEPAAFTWQGRRYPVEEILSGWFDTGHGATPVKSRNWRTRRHRRHFRVRTTCGRVFLLYYDYANREKPVWILDREEEQDAGGE